MLFAKLMSISIRSQMQYRASFVMLSISHFLGTFIDILGIWVLFDRFQMVKGWTLAEVGLIYGIVHIGFAIAEAFSRGFDLFSQTLKTGDFDRLLLRPLSPIFQIGVSQVHAMRIGRLTQGFVVLVVSAGSLDVALFSYCGLILFLAILGTASLFYGLFVVQAAICFWTTESLELMTIATYGGVQTSQYPIDLYGPAIRWIFTLLIPLACVAYYPIAILLQHAAIPLWLGAIFPLAGGVFLFLACQFFRLGVRRYHSTGS